ncbi:MAG: Maf family protein, partial [Chlorobia bacterium]|nr:Maf family protein [Fimbriimonadaceae bacterium]
EMSEIPVLLAKPVNKADACHMLWLLSGRTHKVVTAVALIWPLGTAIASDTTNVTFRELTEEEIDAYIATSEPMDKAGAYAIQGGAAGFVEKTEGSISNVIGLPMELLTGMLDKFLAE